MSVGYTGKYERIGELKIKASDVIGHSRAKWAKKQPHKDVNIYWTTKLFKGVNGSDRAYYAVCFNTRKVVTVQQVWSSRKGHYVWQIGNTRQTCDTLDGAKQYTKGMLVMKGMVKCGTNQ